MALHMTIMHYLCLSPVWSALRLQAQWIGCVESAHAHHLTTVWSDCSPPVAHVDLVRSMRKACLPTDHGLLHFLTHATLFPFIGVGGFTRLELHSQLDAGGCCCSHANCCRSCMLSISAAKSWLLVKLMGQALGLIYRGVKQSLVQQRSRNRKHSESASETDASQVPRFS